LIVAYRIAHTAGPYTVRHKAGPPRARIIGALSWIEGPAMQATPPSSPNEAGERLGDFGRISAAKIARVADMLAAAYAAGVAAGRAER